MQWWRYFLVLKKEILINILPGRLNTSLSFDSKNKKFYSCYSRFNPLEWAFKVAESVLTDAADNSIDALIRYLFCQFYEKNTLSKRFWGRQTFSRNSDYLTGCTDEWSVTDGLAIAGKSSKGKSTYLSELLKTNPNYKLNLRTQLW